MTINIEEYFRTCLSRLSNQPRIRDENLPVPEHPEHPGVDWSNINDEVTLMEDSKGFFHDVDSQIAIGDAQGAQWARTPRELLEGGLRNVGFEAIAYYKSFRYVNENPHRGRWGIFYSTSSILEIADRIDAEFPGNGQSVSLAFKLIREHEMYHYKFDLYALSAEALLGRSLYDPLLRAFRKHAIYCVEEALANRAAWEWARSSKRNPKGFHAFVGDWMDVQPGAYARYREPAFALAAELAANLIDLKIHGMPRRDDQAPWVATVPSVLLRSKGGCPEYRHCLPPTAAWISPAWVLPSVATVSESDDVAKKLAKDPQWREWWDRTKSKLKADSMQRGLGFKPWPPKRPCWSVRVNLNFRAHLHPDVRSPGVWEAVEFGTHKELGHG